MHVVRLVRRIRDDRVELEILLGERVLDGSGDRVGRCHARCRGLVVRRQVGEQILDVVEGVLLVASDVVGDTRLDHVGVGATEVFHGDVFAGDGLDDVGAGDEHLAGLVDHHHEVGQGGGVDVTTGSGPMISEICGITPEACTLRWKISP